jgi:hypothetical protein
MYICIYSHMYVYIYRQLDVTSEDRDQLQHRCCDAEEKNRRLERELNKMTDLQRQMDIKFNQFQMEHQIVLEMESRNRYWSHASSSSSAKTHASSFPPPTPAATPPPRDRLEEVAMQLYATPGGRGGGGGGGGGGAGGVQCRCHHQLQGKRRGCYTWRIPLSI